MFTGYTLVDFTELTVFKKNFFIVKLCLLHLDTFIIYLCKYFFELHKTENFNFFPLPLNLFHSIICKSFGRSWLKAVNYQCKFWCRRYGWRRSSRWCSSCSCWSPCCERRYLIFTNNRLTDRFYTATLTLLVVCSYFSVFLKNLICYWQKYF